MTWLVLGVVLWAGVHLVPSAAPAGKAAAVEALGLKGYKIVFALLIASALVLIVLGWRAAVPAIVYVPPTWAPDLTLLLMIASFVLFGASGYPTRIKRVIRHPQLTAVIVWAVAHLVSNGDSRGLVLFGGLGLWALVSIPLINARDGAREMPEVPPMKRELRGLAISTVIFVVVVLLHPYFTGVSPLPRWM